MRCHNLCFRWEIRKIIFELSSISPPIWSSAAFQMFCCKQLDQKFNNPSSLIFLYWSGISISAARAKAACGFLAVDITLWKSTNWKLSNFLSGRLSSNSSIISQGPSPTPTRMIDIGHFDASTIISLVSLSDVTWPSATITRIWYWNVQQYILLFVWLRVKQYATLPLKEPSDNYILFYFYLLKKIRLDIYVNPLIGK